MKVRHHNNTKEKLKLYSLVMILLWSSAIAIILVMPIEYIFTHAYEYTIPLYIHVIFYVLLFYFLVSQIIPLILIGLKNRMLLSRLKSNWNNASYPQNNRERSVFMWLAFSVGICEEIIYRAFLPYYFQQEPYAFSLMTSIVAASVIFALIHFHQGVMGIVQALFIGFMFSYIFILSGSLWIPIILHVLYDLKVILISKRLEEASNLRIQDEM